MRYQDEAIGTQGKMLPCTRRDVNGKLKEVVWSNHWPVYAGTPVNDQG